MSISSLQTCNTCGARCCKPNLVVNPFNLNLAPGDFSNLYRNGLGAFLSVGYDERYGASFIISPHIFGYCPFLNYLTNECTIYPHRPSICRDFPFDSNIKNSVKESCLFIKHTLPTHIIKSEDDTYVHDSLELNRKEERDQDIYFGQYRMKETNFESDDIYITNKLGSFVFRGQSQMDVTSRSLWPLLNEYAN